MDVHQRSLTAWLLFSGSSRKGHRELPRFGPLTRVLWELADWRPGHPVTPVARESTGVYWKPVWHRLEGQCAVVVVNAQPLKAGPGRQTDLKDCPGIAELLQHGLWRSRVVPPTPIRQVRDLTRRRASWRQAHTAIATRRQKILEDAHSKGASVARDWLGVSGRALLAQLLASEEEASKRAALSRGRLRSKLPALPRALAGPMTEPQRGRLRVLHEHLVFLKAQIAKLEAKIQDQLSDSQEAMALCPTSPGIQEVAAAHLVAERGGNMAPFPSAPH